MRDIGSSKGFKDLAKSQGKKSIYLMRHGETDWNKAKRIQGHTDIPLNAVGRAQARELASKVRLENFDAFFSSDLSRAHETAKIVNEHHALDLVTSSLLRETFMGDAQGMTRDEVIAEYGDYTWDKFLHLDLNNLEAAMPGGETRKELIQRFLEFWKVSISPSSFENIAIACHGGVLRTVIHHLFPELKEAVPIHNCCCYKLNFDGKKFVNFHLVY